MVGGWSAPDEQPAALRRVPGPWVMKSVHDLAPPPQGCVDKMTPSQRGGAMEARVACFLADSLRCAG